MKGKKINTFKDKKKKNLINELIRNQLSLRRIKRKSFKKEREKKKRDQCFYFKGEFAWKLS